MNTKLKALLLCVCLGFAPAVCRAQPPKWNDIGNNVAAQQWQAGASALDTIDVAKLRSIEAAAYCYYMGLCAFHLDGRKAFGRALLLELLQHRMDRIGDAKQRESVRAYVKALLQTQNSSPTFVRWVVAKNGKFHSGGVSTVSGKEAILLGDLGGDLKTEVTPLRVLSDVTVFPHSDLMALLRLPQEKAVAQLQTDMKSSVLDVQTRDNYFLVAVGNGGNSSNHALKDEQVAFCRDIDMAQAFFHNTFDVRLPPEPMTLFAVADQAQMRAVARSLHGIEPSSISIGYSVPDEGTAVAISAHNDHNNTGTLYHELCHVVFQNDFPAIPTWLDEGIASVYSVFSFKNGEMVGSTKQWRSEVLRRVGKWHPSATELVRMTSDEFSTPQKARKGFDPRFFNGKFTPQIAQQGVNNATACYLLLYLQEQGKLAPLYKAFRGRDTQTINGDFGDADVTLLKSIAGENIDREFDKWLAKNTPKVFL